MLSKWTVMYFLVPAVLALFAVHAMADVDAVSPTVCSKGTTLSGIDISGYQTMQNWTTVRQSGVNFTFVKATEGIAITDTDFQKNWQAAKTAGVSRSAYHFFDPSEDAEAQADYYLTTVGSIDNSDLPPMLDLETMAGVSNDEITPRVQIWLTRVEQATGRTPIIYTDASFWGQLTGTTGFDRYPLFVAEYDVNCPKVPLPWKNWTFWQHSDSGTVPGIQDATDLDFFNGMITSLNLL